MRRDDTETKYGFVKWLRNRAANERQSAGWTNSKRIANERLYAASVLEEAANDFERFVVETKP